MLKATEGEEIIKGTGTKRVSSSLRAFGFAFLWFSLLCSAVLGLFYVARFSRSFAMTILKNSLWLWQGLATHTHTRAHTGTLTCTLTHSGCDSWSVRVTSLSFRLPRLHQRLHRIALPLTCRNFKILSSHFVGREIVKV